MELGIVVFVIVAVVLYFKNNKQVDLNESSITEFPQAWRIILNEKVAYYHVQSIEDKSRFENKILEFLNDVRITGIDVKVDDTDKLLVAASAVIPIFGFKDWKYTTIDEVLLYPSSFNEKFETEGDERRILGMVGEGAMNGTMILSKPALIQGFLNETDKQNTAIHEFVHLIDKTDGAIDGIPEVLLNKQYTLPWINLIAKKIEEINLGDSDINPYGATSQTEFLAVASEYFFERPQLLESKHPKLYQLMEHIFKQDMSDIKLTRQKKRIGRNDPCPCNKGKKFKYCCGTEHYN
jgi:MtfA peptidase